MCSAFGDLQVGRLFARELVESVAVLGKDWRVQRCCQGVGVAFREMPEWVHFHLAVLVFVEDAFSGGRLPQRQVADSCSFALPRAWSRIHSKPRSVTIVDMCLVDEVQRFLRQHPLKTAVPNYVRPESTFRFPSGFQSVHQDTYFCEGCVPARRKGRDMYCASVREKELLVPRSRPSIVPVCAWSRASVKRAVKYWSRGCTSIWPRFACAPVRRDGSPRSSAELRV